MKTITFLEALLFLSGFEFITLDGKPASINGGTEDVIRLGFNDDSSDTVDIMRKENEEVEVTPKGLIFHTSYWGNRCNPPNSPRELFKHHHVVNGLKEVRYTA